ncbi:MAG: D-alanine--D-alanine ligase [Nitrospirae bacterium]|nr:D-alanine--D-alanine ligase [Nitrospirota bacterium]MDA1303697.1 D-alanine--D-alanine ligase [Nitrospirota bacterium]
MPLTTAHIGVLMGGASAEREVSLKTGMAIYAALQRQGYRATTIDVDATLPWVLKRKKIDVAFLALHGPGGEDGTVQGLLDVLGMPYTGSGVRASAVGMDKSMSKILVEREGVPVAPGISIRKGQGTVAPKNLKWPLVVKPIDQGSTVGVSIVHTPEQWKKALRHAWKQGSAIIAESFIKGREIAVSVLDGKALPTVEIVAPGGFYDYAAKYEKSETQYLCPAPVTKAQDRHMKDLAVRSYEALGCKGAARVDFRLNLKGRPFFLEINTIPGMTERSLLPMAAAEAGMSYESLTERILQSALKRSSQRASRPKKSTPTRTSR